MLYVIEGWIGPLISIIDNSLDQLRINFLIKYQSRLYIGIIDPLNVKTIAGEFTVNFLRHLDGADFCLSVNPIPERPDSVDRIEGLMGLDQRVSVEQIHHEAWPLPCTFFRLTLSTKLRNPGIEMALAPSNRAALVWVRLRSLKLRCTTSTNAWPRL